MRETAPLAPAKPPSVLELLTDLLRRPWVTVDARHHLDEYLQTERLTPRALADRQRALLRRMAWHCFLHVPYHQRRLRDRLKPHAIEQIADVAELPLAPGADRRAHPDEFVATTNERVAVRRLTAGTRGVATPVVVDEEADARQTAIRLRAERWAGTPPAQIVAAWGRQRLRSPRRLDDAEARALAVALRRGRRVLSTPADALPLLGAAIAEAESLGALLVRGEDPFGYGARVAKERGARLHRLYATSEVGVIAASCEAGGLHVAADHLILEVVDEHGRPRPAGERGRLVVTDLFNRAAPYLRHDLGDEGRLLSSSCPCGRSLPLLEVHGRT